MYNVKLQVLVMNGVNKETSNKTFYATNDIELPFVPFPNLSITLGDSINWRGSWHIKEVHWSLQTSSFICNCEDKVLDLVNVEQIMYDDWLRILPSWGWQIYPQT